MDGADRSAAGQLVVEESRGTQRVANDRRRQSSRAGRSVPDAGQEVPALPRARRLLRHGSSAHPRNRCGMYSLNMENTSIAILVTIGFSIFGVVGDYFLKLASAEPVWFKSKWFYVGFAIYASTAFGWVFVMKHLKLATI